MLERIQRAARKCTAEGRRQIGLGIIIIAFASGVACLLVSGVLAKEGYVFQGVLLLFVGAIIGIVGCNAGAIFATTKDKESD